MCEGPGGVLNTATPFPAQLTWCVGHGGALSTATPSPHLPPPVVGMVFSIVVCVSGYAVSSSLVTQNSRQRYHGRLGLCLALRALTLPQRRLGIYTI